MKKHIHLIPSVLLMAAATAVYADDELWGSPASVGYQHGAFSRGSESWSSNSLSLNAILRDEERRNILGDIPMVDMHMEIGQATGGFFFGMGAMFPWSFVDTRKVTLATGLGLELSFIFTNEGDTPGWADFVFHNLLRYQLIGRDLLATYDLGTTQKYHKFRLQVPILGGFGTALSWFYYREVQSKGEAPFTGLMLEALYSF